MRDETRVPFALPDGWTMEPYDSRSGSDDVMVIKRPDHGYVTVDYVNRRFASGISVSVDRNVPGVRYGGRGWRNKLLRAACEWLAR